MYYHQGSNGTRHGSGAGCGANGYGGRSMQKAVLRSPNTINGKELPGLAVSRLAAPLCFALCCNAATKKKKRKKRKKRKEGKKKERRKKKKETKARGC